MFDSRPPYITQLARLVDLDRLRAAGLNVCVDAMYGTGAGYFEELIGGGATKVTELHGFRNPIFPGMHAPEPIARNLTEMEQTMRAQRFDAGIANDGDADRVGIADENGVFINQLQVFGLLCYYMLEARGERGPIVKSITTTAMAERLGEAYGVPVHETQVGFRFLGPKMMESDALIGGEESGGYGFADTCRSATAFSQASTCSTSWRGPASARANCSPTCTRRSGRTLRPPRPLAQARGPRPGLEEGGGRASRHHRWNQGHRARYH